VGLSIGSIIGGRAIQKSRRNAIFYFNALAIIGSLICQVMTTPTLCLGRFLCGLAGGVLNVVSSKSIYETVPGELSGLYGNFTNIFIGGGIMLTTICGLTLPKEEVDYAADEMWRFVFGVPILISVVQILLFLIVYRTEPIAFSVKSGDEASAR
jgi:MFS family permease